MAELTISTEPNLRKTQYSAPALEKGLDLLELLSNEVDGLKLADIARKLDKSVSELFRMIVVLEQRGYVEMPVGSDKYRLTLKMLSLSNRFYPIQRLTSIASPLMQSLSFDIGQSCHLVIYYEGKGRVVGQQDSSSSRVFRVPLGSEESLINTCSGHLLLAFSNKVKRKVMLMRRPKNHDKADKKTLNNRIDRVKAQGFENIAIAQTHGAEDIGYPVFDSAGQIAAALVVPFINLQCGAYSDKIDLAHINIKNTANEMSRLLGFEG
jgi:DNA-binding IclR family transcriptional regulator